ncbi:hypothetical protein [Haliangium sp.]|uniref:hypothetical protein n=1 Tax=Haliangium sp. TaxID=2663208 RepID=UPI003D13D094
MTRAPAVVIALAVVVAPALVLGACSRQNGDNASSVTPSVSPTASTAKPALPQPSPSQPTPAADEPSKPMDDPNLQSDPGLEPVDGAEVTPLPSGALMRYQIIRLGVGCRGNYRFLLHADGRVFMQENGARANCEPPQRFDADYPAEPMGTLTQAQVDEIKALMRKHDFFALSVGYKRPNRRFDGAMEILEVQLEGKTHRVVLEKVEHPAVSALRDAVLTPLYNP